MDYGIKKHERYGYKHLDPIPSPGEISSFYEGTFAEMVKEGKTGPGMKRLLEGGEEAKWEREWRRSTWYSDISHFIQSINPDSASLLDVGCGIGELLLFAESEGFDTVGVEPSPELGKRARNKGLSVHTDKIENFAEYYTKKFDVVSMIQVLHHIRSPEEVIGKARNLLNKGGIIVVKTPNDFNSLQKSITSKSEADKWWVRSPMVINYFDYKSLAKLLEGEGFSVEVEYADFPMELFLLMGDDYIDGPARGEEVHKKRVRFEKSIPDRVRRDMYSSFANTKIGRNVTILGVKK